MTCDKVCRICGNRFTGTNGKACYCSDHCRTIGKEQRSREWEERCRKPRHIKSIFSTKQCAKCGKEYRGTKNSKYCDNCMLTGGSKMREYYYHRKYTEEDAK